MKFAFLLWVIPVLAQAELVWRELPALPQALGGQFVGVVDDHLVVAGGSHFDGVPPPWAGGRKLWVDSIYTLRRGDKLWKLAGRLPHPMGYGGATSLGDSMLLIGGQTATETLREVHRLRLVNGEAKLEAIASLPHPVSNLAAALVGGTIFVAGGQRTSTSTTALNSLLALENGRWQELAAWPGPGAIMPMAAGTSQAFYLIGGAELTGTPGPPPGRRFLTQVWRYRQSSGWEKQPALAAPAQAGYAIADGEDVLLFGGNDGALAPREFEVKDKHPGFSRLVQRLHNGKWSKEGEMPMSLVTSGIVRWGDEFVIAGGEDRPAHRSNRVMAAKKK